MSVTGSDANKAQIAADIEAYLKSLEPGETLYRSQLIAIAIQDGAADVTITVPAADVVPIAYQMISPGVISVT